MSIKNHKWKYMVDDALQLHDGMLRYQYQKTAGMVDSSRELAPDEIKIEWVPTR
jgi:hypothetical protein